MKESVMRKRDFIRLRRTSWTLRRLESSISKVWDRTYCTKIYEKDEHVDFEVSNEEVLSDLTEIGIRLSWARSLVDDLIHKAYERN